MGRVLLVDDDANVLLGHGRVLQRAGFEVETSSSAERALQLLESTRFDVVLLDLRLPHMDGLALLRVLRERQDAVPVVLLTGSLTADSAADAINLGVARCLQKPITARELTDGVTRVVTATRVLH
jgi:DNA-binding NtrC family response regulator